MNDQIISTELVAVKPCRACGAVDRNKRGKCNLCMMAYRLKWSEQNPEKFAESQRKYRKDNCEQLLMRQRKYREANRKQVIERDRKYREANREKFAEYKYAYRKANVEKIKTYNHNRRANSRDKGRISSGIILTLLTKQNNKCVCCGASLDNGYHLDHIMPLALGGMNDDSNVQLLTPKCNMSKGSKHPDVWAGEKGIKLS